MKRTILIFFLIISAASAQAQSKILEQIKEDNSTDVSLYFYPSTLRMINLQHNKEFNELVKDIKKMSFLKLRRNRFDHQKFLDIVIKLQQKEDLEEYIVVDGRDQKLYLLGRESPASTVAMAYFQGEYYAIDIAGKISIAELPKLYEQLSQNDSTLKNDFGSIFNLVQGASDFGNDHRKGNRRND